MEAALECWSGRPSTDEDAVDQVLMKNHDRSEAFHRSAPASAASSATSSPTHHLHHSTFSSPSHSNNNNPPLPKRWHRLGRNFSNAIASLKNSLNLDAGGPRYPSPPPSRFDRGLWGGIIRGLTQLYPGSQLPEKLISNISRHFDSLPNSYGQAGFDMKEVLLHVRLIEQASEDDQPALQIQEVHHSKGEGVLFKLTFACCSPLSWPTMSEALDSSLICCKRIQIFEKRGLTLGVVTVLAEKGNERQFKVRAEAALRAAVKKPKNNGVKLPFGLCGCQEESYRSVEDDSHFNGDDAQGIDNESARCFQLPSPLPMSSVVVSIDEWQTIVSGGNEIRRWLLSSDEVELNDRIGSNSFKGVYRGKKAWIKKLRGCERGTAYDIEIRQDLLQLMSCGNKYILQIFGVCIEENHGLCVLTRMMNGGSVYNWIHKNKKFTVREAIRIALDVAEGLMFMNNHGVAYRDLNIQRILLDRHGNACLGDMGVVTPCNNVGEVKDYETAGYRWLAPEIIAGDPESVTETWMSNVYSFAMVLWEILTGEAAYSSYSPVQAAVGIAACGLRPEIPKECPQYLRSLMARCWNSSPSKRPLLSEIVAILRRQSIQ